MQLGFARIESNLGKLDARFEAKLDGGVQSLRADFTAAIEKGLRDQTRFFFVAWSVILAAIVGLYAR